MNKGGSMKRDSHKYILFLIVHTLVLNVHLCAMDKEEKKEREEKIQSDVAPQGQPSQSFFAGGRFVALTGGPAERDEKLDLDDSETFTLSTFRELIDEARTSQPEITYILARVETEEESKTFVHYFDAHEFNRLRFDGYKSIQPPTGIAQYPNRDLGRLEFPLGKPNPLNQLLIKLGNVTYYVFDPQSRQLHYLCSDMDIVEGDVRSGFLWNFFLSNQLQNRRFLNQARLFVGIYCAGSLKLPPFFDKEMRDQYAYTYFNFLAEQNEDRNTQAYAWYMLGKLYLKNKGLQQKFSSENCVKYAAQYFMRAASQNHNQQAQMEASLDLAQLYLDPQGYFAFHTTEWRINKALGYLRIVAEQTAFPELQMKVNFYLGKLYREGTEGVAVDYRRAREYFELLRKVAQEHSDKFWMESAELNLRLLDELEAREHARQMAHKHERDAESQKDSSKKAKKE